MGDDDDGHILFLHHPPQHGEELVGLLGSQHGGGLVQDQHLRTPVEGLQDLHTLLQAHAQLAHHIRRIHIQAVFPAQLRHRLIGGLQIIQHTQLLRFPAQNDVLGHGEAGNQHEMLVDHAHTQGDGMLGVVLGDGFSLDDHLAPGGGEDSVENVHQGGFSRAVFAHQGKDLALADGKIHILIGPDTGEFHGDIAKLYNGIHSISSNRLKAPAHIQTNLLSGPAPYPRHRAPQSDGMRRE